MQLPEGLWTNFFITHQEDTHLLYIQPSIEQHYRRHNTYGYEFGRELNTTLQKNHSIVTAYYRSTICASVCR